MKRKNNFITALCIVPVIFIFSRFLNAQPDKYFREYERKTYFLQIEDLQRGYCTFEIKKENNRFLVRSENVLYITIPETVFRERSEFSLQILPLKYNLEIISGNVPRSFDVEFAGGKTLLKDTFKGYSKDFTWDIGRDYEILDNNIMNHWYILLKKYYGSSQDEAEVELVVPVIKRNVKTTLKKAGAEIIEVEKKKYTAFKIEGELKNKSKFSGWVDAESGDLIKFSFPDQKFELVPGDSVYPFTDIKEEKPEVGKHEVKSEGLFPEENVQFGLSEWKIKGKLTFPENRAENCPAVVLVHGSGPQDEDETIGPNKPFRDIAEGLNRRGYAVLRYVKRTKEYGPLLDLKSLTVEEESIQDAVEAVKYLASRKDIDKDRLFLLGHSLGGFVAPFIATKAHELKGFIIAAGNTRPLVDLVKEQVKFQSITAGLSDSAANSRVNEITELYESVLKSDYSELKLWLGVTRKYLEDMNAKNPVRELVKLTMPVLIIQGENDCQVSMEDFIGWEEGVERAERKNVVFKSFPGINHLFMHVEGKSTGAEYMMPGRVDKDVIDSIADWLDSISTRKEH